MGLPAKRLCLEDFSQSFPSSETSRWQTSLTIPFSSHPRPSVLHTGYSSKRPSRPPSPPPPTFPWVQWYCRGPVGSQRGTGKNLERTLYGDSLYFCVCEESWPLHQGSIIPKKWKPLSRHYYQMDCLSDYRPIKIKISSSTRPFHSLLLSLFLRLVFGMNRGLWSNPHHPEAWTRELRKTDSGKVMANMAIDQQFHLDLCLLMPTFSVLLYWRKER